MIPGLSMMRYLQRRPAAPLDGHIEAIWVCRAPQRPRMLERVLPSGAPQLILNLAEDRTRAYEPAAAGFRCHVSSGSILTGLTTRYQIIDTDEQQYVAGVSFRPGGTLPFFAPRVSVARCRRTVGESLGMSFHRSDS